MSVIPNRGVRLRAKCPGHRGAGILPKYWETVSWAIYAALRFCPPPFFSLASVAEIAPQQGVQLQRLGYGDGVALDADQGEAAPFCESAGKGFADGAEFAGQHPLGAAKADFGGRIG